MKRRCLPMIARMLAILTLWSSSTATLAAGDQALLLANSLMDKETVCVAYVQAQHGFVDNIVASWGTAQREQSADALYTELRPLLTEICGKSWAIARAKLADTIEAEMPTADRALVYKYLSSRAGEKYILAVRAGIISAANGADPAPPPSFTPEEEALGRTTFASAAWSKYKLLREQRSVLFRTAHAQVAGAYDDELMARVKAVKARFGR